MGLTAEERESIRGTRVDDKLLQTYYNAISQYKRDEKALGNASLGELQMDAERKSVADAYRRSPETHPSAREIRDAASRGDRQLEARVKNFENLRGDIEVYGEMIRSGNYHGNNRELYAKAVGDADRTDAYLAGASENSRVPGEHRNDGTALPSLTQDQSNQLARGIAAQAVEHGQGQSRAHEAAAPGR